MTRFRILVSLLAALFLAAPLASADPLVSIVSSAVVVASPATFRPPEMTCISPKANTKSFVRGQSLVAVRRTYRPEVSSVVTEYGSSPGFLKSSFV